MYETARLLSGQSYQHWISNEFLSFSWFFAVGMLAVFYTVWFKLVDKRKLGQLLLLGTLSSVGFIIGEIVLLSTLGLAEYKIRVLPLTPPLFLVSVTIAPILFMLIQQFTTSWKSYVLWVLIGMGALAFGLIPLYSLIGILQLYKWNYFYQFLLMITNGIIARGLLLLVISIQQSQSKGSRVIKVFPGIQPVATKPLDSSKVDAIDIDDDWWR
ncbi:MAG: hypothetical protein K0R78_2400 [Pelosinus sp.]|nr:hypothetical protein [Pelosinus sp.]